MRVLIVNSMFANALYRRCADELGRIPDVDLTMLTVDGWRMNGRPMPFEELVVGSPYRTVVGNAGWKGYENRGFYTSGVARAFRLSKPDVFFLMEEPFSVFAAELLAAKSLFAPKAPVVFFTWNNLSLTTFDYRPSFFYRSVSRLTLPRMHYALTANNAGIEVLRDFGFNKPIKTVGYGVDTVAYSSPRAEQVAAIRSSLGIAVSDIVVGYVGRLLHMKGIDLLIDAVSHLVEQGMPNLKLLLIGSGEAEQMLLAQAQQRGISQIIRHVPTVKHGEVPDYMHALNILVLPSRRVGMWAEQFGRVLVEAMAAGKIVIGSSSGAIPEVIGDAGFVFEENNSADLTRVLAHAVQLLDEDRITLAGRARHRARNDYSWQRFANDAFEAIDYCHKTYNLRSPRP